MSIGAVAGVDAIYESQRANDQENPKRRPKRSQTATDSIELSPDALAYLNSGDDEAGRDGQEIPWAR